MDRRKVREWTNARRRMCHIRMVILSAGTPSCVVLSCICWHVIETKHDDKDRYLAVRADWIESSASADCDFANGSISNECVAKRAIPLGTLISTSPWHLRTFCGFCKGPRIFLAIQLRCRFYVSSSNIGQSVQAFRVAKGCMAFSLQWQD